MQRLCALAPFDAKPPSASFSFPLSRSVAATSAGGVLRENWGYAIRCFNRDCDCFAC
jgi:hypothetical protein